MARVLILVLLMLLIGVCSSSSSSSSSSSAYSVDDTYFCIPTSFLDDLAPKCPLHLMINSPLQIDGDSLDRVLRSRITSTTAVLFYDSTSPLSATAPSKFNVLSSLFPQITHLALDKSSVMPSLYSRYGIHSLPVFFIITQEQGPKRYYGNKHLQSVITFYTTFTGLDPAEYVVYDENIDILDHQIELHLSWREIIVKEPLLVFATLFLIMRASIYLYPALSYRIMSLWILCKRQYNLGMFGESSQLLGRLLHLIDVNRMCKTTNFQNGARSARVWASSLASVSLGETSSARPSSSVES